MVRGTRSLEATYSGIKETPLYGKSAPARVGKSAWTTHINSKNTSQDDVTDANTVVLQGYEQRSSYSSRRQSTSSCGSVFVYPDSPASTEEQTLKDDSRAVDLSDKSFAMRSQLDLHSKKKHVHVENLDTVKAKQEYRGSQGDVGYNDCQSCKQAALELFKSMSQLPLSVSQKVSATEIVKRYRSLHSEQDEEDDRPSADHNVELAAETSRTASMWVGYLKRSVSFKDIQEYFYDANVLHIQYRRGARYARITYCNREAMENSIKRYNNTVFDGSVLQCWPLVQEDDLQEMSAKQGNWIWYGYGYRPHITQYGNTYFEAGMYLLNSYQWDYGHHRELTWASGTTFTGIQTVSARYLVMKPWAPEDMQISFDNGYWSIPSSKVELLNAVFEASTAEEVYLIFSVTGSGEFHGYARMLSPVLDVYGRDTYKYMEGTPFDRKNSDHLPNVQQPQFMRLWSSKKDTLRYGKLLNVKRRPRAWRHVFRLEWLVIQSLPFRKTKNLCNAWSMGASVNNSADCTELEPTVAEQLVRMIQQASGNKNSL
ncbi:hypothetical protein EC973_004263 [Apophysomyces ossiformis]|uniref:YTH domain-containing protein n=1 Tax=Apophysomyces ossiformis TaxID=679940 RepID=A0A8H7BGC5_9FUNG|nr:hypothetical protein EC973_004263 [Apophysomyces ossiformis]